MRAVLLDWLVEVCKEFTLKRETLHLAIHNFDRFMVRHENIARNELQLYGIASLYIACKIEEIYPPKVSDFSQASNYGFSNHQILKAE
jgi:G1/S-specific cyclin-E1